MVPTQSPRTTCLWSDGRGAIYVEFIVAVLPLFIFFECLAQLADLYGAKLIVEHAAYRAARGASVIFGDDCARYEPRGKLYDIRTAAERVLQADPSITASAVQLPTGTKGYKHGDIATVRVTGRYECKYPLADRIVCLTLWGEPFLWVSAEVSMPVHNPEYSASSAEGCE